MSKVFVLEPPKANIDVTKAERYGEVVYVFERDTRRPSVFQSTSFGEAVIRRLAELGYDPVTDYLAVAGSIVPVVIALMACIVQHHTVNVLFWHAGETTYVRRRIDADSWVHIGDSHAGEDAGTAEKVA